MNARLVRLLAARLDPALKGYNCAKCSELFYRNKMKPACLSGMCPIVDIAPDIRLNKLVQAFIQVESLDLSPGYAQFQGRLLRESGLEQETPETILALKGVIADFRDRESKQKPGASKRS